MVSKDILKKIASIEIHTKRILAASLMGDSRSAQKGSGFEFSQIRDYYVGDDVRFIDWRASARSNKLLVREYIEERSRTIMILLDISKSTLFTSGTETKASVMQQVAAILALVGNHSKDRVGLIIYAGDVERVIPPAYGQAHVHAILEAIFASEPVNSGTHGAAALRRLSTMKQRHMAVFMITDGIDTSLPQALKLAARRYEIVLLRCADSLEQTIPRVGFLPIMDLETGEAAVLDTRSRGGKRLQAYLQHKYVEDQTVYAGYGIDCLNLVNNETFFGDVVRFFRRRMTY